MRIQGNCVRCQFKAFEWGSARVGRRRRGRGRGRGVAGDGDGDGAGGDGDGVDPLDMGSYKVESSQDWS